ncbi:hypothetical protein B0A48_03003 [Cryoendolithus antarcticus]|uniref:Uncharacterized protein n=1 Tax=Cryoendolithus antarcticus TaxID=1507870 RepID=A0A1V8TM75_9PEZI|nr:hypothetical protein B0A48_03003 [Cryoendolithus antarcticus]
MASPAGSDISERLLLICPEHQDHSNDHSVLVSEGLLRKRSTKLAENIDRQVQQHITQTDNPAQHLILMKLPLELYELKMYADFLRGAEMSPPTCYYSFYIGSLTIYNFALEWDDVEAADAALDAVRTCLLDNPHFFAHPVRDALVFFKHSSPARHMLVDILATPGMADYREDNDEGHAWLDVNDLNFTLQLCRALGRELAATKLGEEDEDVTEIDEGCRYHLHVALGLPCYKDSMME